MTTLTTYAKLKLHLERHVYKRGAYKGDAPAEKRSKTHLRVVQKNDCMVVRMYKTDIITAYEDGSIKLSTGTWWTNTTRANMNEALRNFVPFYIGIGSRSVFSMVQRIVNARGTTYAFYDGIRFNAEGTLTSQPMAFERKRANKAEREEFRKDIAESGFQDTFPILYASAEIPQQGWMSMNMDRIVRNDVYANEWPLAVSIIKYPTFGHRLTKTVAYEDWRNAWKALMRQCTKDMVEVVRTDVTTL